MYVLSALVHLVIVLADAFFGVETEVGGGIMAAVVAIMGRCVDKGESVDAHVVEDAVLSCELVDH